MVVMTTKQAFNVQYVSKACRPTQLNYLSRTYGKDDLCKLEERSWIQLEEVDIEHCLWLH